MLFCNTEKNLVIEMHHKSFSSPEPQWRSSWQKLALFFFFTNLCLLFHLWTDVRGYD